MADLVCVGRPVDDELRPYGKPCGRGLHARAGEVEQVARAAGWLVTGRDPSGQLVGTCRQCRRPGPEVAALVTERDKAREGGR